MKLAFLCRFSWKPIVCHDRARDSTKAKLKRTAFFRRLIVVSLRNPVAPQEWLERCFDAVDCEQTVAPLPVPVGASDSWRFVSATSNETTATFQFAAGALQLQSVWAARPGGGPSEKR